MTILIIEVDQRLSRGIGWFGQSEGNWDNPLVGHMRYFDGIAVELEHSTADLRAMNAFGSIERLRADLERLTNCLREVADLYHDDSWTAYVDARGESIEYGREDEIEPTITLRADHLDKIIQLRRQCELLFRTSMYRLYGSDSISGYEAQWPVESRPNRNLDTDPLWGSEPRPIS